LIYQNLLDEHVKWQLTNGLHLQPTATSEQIESVFRRARERLGCELPVEYARFLDHINGLNSNGLVVYASEPAVVAGSTDVFIEGIIEANEAWRDDPANSSFLFFGEGNISRYVLNCKVSRYQVLDYQTDTLIEEVPGFDELLFAALREHRP
jgi:hypothetical protein